MGNGRVEDHWRDTDVQIEGPVVEYLQGAFAENWVEATGMVLGGADYFPAPDAVKGQTHAQIIRSGPLGGSYAMYTTFLLALSSAQRSIKITNPYVLLDEQMIETLLQAAQRGVESASSCPASAITRSSAMRAGGSSASCSRRASRSTSTSRPSSTPRRWSSTASGRPWAARISTTARSG